MRGADVTVNGYELPVSQTRPRCPIRQTRSPAARSARSTCRRPTSCSARRSSRPSPRASRPSSFGMGCFWGAERDFWQTPGVYTTAVGYAGGFTPNPTYEEVCSGRTGHNEVVLVAFRPEEISFDELLRVFWEGHDPTQGMRQGNDVGTQYRSGIYVTSDAQRKAARGLARHVPGAADRRRATARSRPRSWTRPSSITPRTTTSSTSRRTRTATAGRRHRRQLPNRSAISLSRSSASGGQSAVSGGHHAHSSCSSSGTGSQSFGTVASADEHVEPGRQARRAPRPTARRDCSRHSS